MDERELWSRSRSGDAPAFAGLYRLHADRVFTHLYQRVASVPTAEDLTAEVFTTAWRRHGDIRFQDSAGVLPWLLVCANNVLRNHRRTAGRRSQLLTRISTERHEPDIADIIADAIEQRERAALLAQVLARLPSRDRDVIQLCLVQGLTAETVAAATGDRPGTVRTRLSRALQRARRVVATVKLPQSSHISVSQKGVEGPDG